jgi:hypothetical protein
MLALTIFLCSMSLFRYSHLAFKNCFSIFISLYIIVTYVLQTHLPYAGGILISLYLFLYPLVSKFPVKTILTEFKLYRSMYNSLSRYTVRLEISFIKFFVSLIISEYRKTWFYYFTYTSFKSR